METMLARRREIPDTPAGKEQAVPGRQDTSPPGWPALPPLPAPAADDPALLRRVAARDPDALEQLAQRYARHLRGYLRRRLPPHVPPEDVLPEVLLAVWHHAARWDPRTPLLAWLLGIARHKALKAQRAARSRSMPPLAGAAASVAEAAEALEVRATRHERARAVMRAVAGLPPAERQVVELTYYHDLSYPEIAARLACPVNTVKTRMVRARHRLAPQLLHWS